MGEPNKDRSKKLSVLPFISILLFMGGQIWAPKADAHHTPGPTTTTIVGNLQSELGCPGDWQPDCAATHLTYDAGDDVWQGTFSTPAGSWEYKAALNDSWDEHYGGNAQQNGPNIPLDLAGPEDVKFYYDHKSHWVTDNLNSVIATVIGSFQDEISCPGDWQPDCLRSWLQDPDGDGAYGFATNAIPAGSYEAKVAHDESFAELYGEGGLPSGENIPFTVGPGETVTFQYDPVSHVLTITSIGAVTTTTVVGDLQSELGCPGDWQPDCAATHLTYDAGDDVWQGTFSTPAGSWEYKAALNDSWDEHYGGNAQQNGPNIPLDLAGPEDVKFYYDHKSHWVTDNLNSVIATVIGSFQDEISCPGDWQPDCLRSWLQDPDGDGAYGFATNAIPAGSYEAKVAHDESFAELYGEGGLPSGENIPFTVGPGETVTFQYDPVSHVLTITSIVEPPEGPAHAVIHYFRDDGDYGDHTTGDFNDYWGLHLWGDIDETIFWPDPKPFLGEDEYGRFAWVYVVPNATNVGLIIHRGDVKDGTTADRFFDPNSTPEIWLKSDDASVYVSQAEAQGFATVHYHRDDGDYGDPTSSDFNDFWGLHLWGDAIDPSEVTPWPDPKRPDGFDSYGAFFTISLQDASQPVNFIVHRGDLKDPDAGPDRSFNPLETSTIWLRSGDLPVYTQRGAAEDFAILHYRRALGDYGDFSSNDYNDFWGLHTWGSADDPGWLTPKKPVAMDIFGLIFHVDLFENTDQIGYILHRGDQKDPGPDQFMVFGTHGHEVWQLENAPPDWPYILPVSVGAVNHPPEVTTDYATVLVDEGDPADNEGTYSDEDDDSVILGASIGTVTGYSDGTWSWTFPTNDGPDDGQIVTISAYDGNGGIGQTTFDLAVNNMAPTISSMSNNGPILEHASVDITLDASDPAGANDPLSYSFDCNNDGVFEIGPQTANSAICSFDQSGEYDVHAKVMDDDGDVASGSTTVAVLTPQGAIHDFIVVEIEDLVANGYLNQGQGAALMRKLKNAARKLDQTNINAAINMLSAFMNQINDFVSQGILSTTQGQTLIDAAIEIIDSIRS